jgi:hypothetical protein
MFRVEVDCRFGICRIEVQVVKTGRLSGRGARHARQHEDDRKQ